jgi:CBS domain containing-hemolysin-like protein
LFSLTSETLLGSASIIGSSIILLVFIFIGIIFDIIGVSVTSANEKVFHSMNAKKVKGANVAVIFKKNANRVSSFCNDIVGDICGIVSGSATVILARSISDFFHLNILVVSLALTGLVASLTIGEKQ